MNLRLIPKALYEQYKKVVSENALLKSFNNLKDVQLFTPNFNFNHAVAKGAIVTAVSSAKAMTR
ncbi:hypothetical protein AY601_0527 [Pedobacter cryoconitis]|uniref:Uncharacterized protein n=1 Tax=Pedobacter cryoconitis TaxID=188932 RepID=A0A127V7X1_9SPHI|nr:hypothetical protein [Pedobacter cryoconitis]AMP97482.1 hypothetical protein AY601_0527 [Pedobacter cryoconitis]